LNGASFPAAVFITGQSTKGGGCLKLAVIADFHLGTKWATPRRNDSFEQAKEAVEKAIELGAQLILVLGDIFDERIPRQPEIWANALNIFSIPSLQKQSEVRLDRTIDKPAGKISPAALRGIPVVALHGNHERRTRGFTNPVEALESAGLLIHLHNNSLVFDTPEGKLAIHGMSNVPEQQALAVLGVWSPKPVDGALNILALHQSVGNFVYSTEERPTLDLPDLPPGFDLYLCGHIHYRQESTVHGKPLLLPGSTERTQLLLMESQIPKGFYMIEWKDGVKYSFVELNSTRDFFYEEMKFNEVAIPELNRVVRAKVEEMLKRFRKNQDKLPLARLRLVGSLAKEASRSDFDEHSIIQEYSGRALLAISKGDLTVPGLEEKLNLLREFREKRMSLDEQAMALLESHLKDVKHVRMLDVRELYELLVEEKVDEALERITQLVEGQTNAEVGASQ
jgi:DNA repair exonuclease SbcCD nuclease subunit